MPDSTFQLPADVTCERSTLPDGTPCWNFRHMDLGNLGRILARPLPDRHWQIECEIAGDTDDPMMEKRKAVFGPLSQALNTELEWHRTQQYR